MAALIRAHIESGDPSAATRVHEEHATALDQSDLGDPDDQVEEALSRWREHHLATMNDAVRLWRQPESAGRRADQR